MRLRLCLSNRWRFTLRVEERLISLKAIISRCIINGAGAIINLVDIKTFFDSIVLWIAFTLQLYLWWCTVHGSSWTAKLVSEWEHLQERKNSRRTWSTRLRLGSSGKSLCGKHQQGRKQGSGLGLRPFRMTFWDSTEHCQSQGRCNKTQLYAERTVDMLLN